MLKLKSSLVFATLLASAWPLTQARAHITLEAPLVGRNGNQKAGPCEGKARGPVYKFEPGATIELKVDEGFEHDGYFRIAFDDDGEDGFVDPASIKPINPNRNGAGKPACMSDPEDQCGRSDFCNVLSDSGGATVLLDNLDPHIPEPKLFPGKRWSWTVTLPNVECTNCTLQVMQVMEDPLGHGPFDGKGDLYYRCIDIVLEKGVGKTPGTVDQAKPVNGLDCTKAEMTDAGVVLPETPVTPILPDAGIGAGTGDGDGHSDHDGHGDGEHDHDAGTPPASSPGPVALPSSDGGCNVGFGGHAETRGLLAFGLACLALVLVRRRKQTQRVRAHTNEVKML